MSSASTMARGHVRKRGGSSYQAIVYAGIDPVTKRQRYLRDTARTQKEAERALTRLLSQVDEQRTPNTSATVGYLLDRWLELAQLELTTRDTYEAYIRRHVRPVLGGVPLRKLTVDVLDRFYLRLARHGGRCPRCMTRVASVAATPPRNCSPLGWTCARSPAAWGMVEVARPPYGCTPRSLPPPTAAPPSCSANSSPGRAKPSRTMTNLPFMSWA